MLYHSLSSVQNVNQFYFCHKTYIPHVLPMNLFKQTQSLDYFVEISEFVRTVVYMLIILINDMYLLI